MHHRYLVITLLLMLPFWAKGQNYQPCSTSIVVADTVVLEDSVRFHLLPFDDVDSVLWAPDSLFANPVPSSNGLPCPLILRSKYISLPISSRPTCSDGVSQAMCVPVQAIIISNRRPMATFASHAASAWLPTLRCSVPTCRPTITETISLSVLIRSVSMATRCLLSTISTPHRAQSCHLLPTICGEFPTIVPMYLSMSTPLICGIPLAATLISST